MLIDRDLKKVYIWKTPINMNKGPCQDGFHIPTKDERDALVSIMNTLNLTTASNYSTYLKIPVSGRLNVGGSFGDSNVGWYWSTTNMGGSLSDSFYDFNVVSGGGAGISGGLPTTYGGTIRPFKDTPTSPDSSWTALYSNKIYWNSTLGLISVSSDGTNWITIADKNAGAENVNDNGRYYQWGNNYGFPQSGFDKSSTKIDTSGYGSTGIPYSSSTFISGDNNWMVDINSSLRDYSSGGDIIVWGKNDPQSAVVFSFTGKDQHYTIPVDGDYDIICKGGGAYRGTGGYSQGIFHLTKGTKLSIMVGGGPEAGTYGFGGTGTYGYLSIGGGLSGVFTGEGAITNTDSARALIIAGGSGYGQRWNNSLGGAGGGLTGGNGSGDNGTAGGGGTQTGRSSSGVKGGGQFSGGAGTLGGGGGWRGGNGSYFSSPSGVYTKGGGGGSGYVHSSAIRSVMKAGGGPTEGHGQVSIQLIG